MIAQNGPSSSKNRRIAWTSRQSKRCGFLVLDSKDKKALVKEDSQVPHTPILSMES